MAGGAAAAPPVAVLAALPQARAAGSGLLRFWGFEVYRAQLWVEPGFRRDSFERHAFALDIEYLRSLRGRDIAQRSIDEMRRQAPLDEARAQQWLAAMQRMFPDVQRGDRLTGVYRPGRGALFLHNGREIGTQDDAEFARRFFAIWLARETSEPGLREQLLAGTE